MFTYLEKFFPDLIERIRRLPPAVKIAVPENTLGQVLYLVFCDQSWLILSEGIWRRGFAKVVCHFNWLSRRALIQETRPDPNACTNRLTSTLTEMICRQSSGYNHWH